MAKKDIKPVYSNNQKSNQVLASSQDHNGLQGRYYVRIVWATAYRSLLENSRAYPWSFFASRVLTAFFTIALAYLLYNVLFQGGIDSSFQDYTGSDDYLTFIVIGVGIQSFIGGALLNLGRSLITERRMGTLESLFLAPIRHSSYLTGVMFQQVMLVCFDFIIILAISLVFGASFNQTNWSGFILVLLIGQIGFMGMAVILGAAMLYLRDTYLTQNTVMAILYLMCGIFFPIQYLPIWVQHIAHFIPLTHVLVLARNSALLNYGLMQQWRGILFLVVLSLFYYAVGIFLLGKVRKVALETALS